jgi:small subunit ribosomal protein S20
MLCDQTGAFMPTSLSAAKRVRQNEKARLSNKARNTELRGLAKKIEHALGAGRRDEAQGLFRTLIKRLDQAAAKHVIHPNTAARQKSRFAHKLSPA